MPNETEIWRLAAEAARNGEPAALLIVTESSGSSPGRRGFKMAVTGGRIEGSIGGGVMEMGLVDETRNRLGSIAAAEIVELVHRPNSPHSSGMICSGSQRVLVCPIRTEDHTRLAAIVLASERGDEISFCVGPRGIAPEDAIGESVLFAETLGTRPLLYVVGGGHCALALCEVMARVGFRIEMFDDRAGLNTIEKNRFAAKKTILESYETIGDFVPAGENHYVVVMTIGYRFDEIVIRCLLGREFAYFGVLGSRAKMSALLRGLAAEGFDPEKLARLRTPAGLPINSRTPEEIAVSIAAEIIAVKNGARLPRNRINLGLQ